MKNHQPIQAHKHQNQFQMPQYNSTTHQASHRPQHPTPQQRGSLPVNLQILQPLICRSNQPNLKTCFQEHIRYIVTNNPHSAYAQHILHNQHEYGTLNASMTLLKPLKHENMLIPYEQFHIQSLHQAGKLIPEQCPGKPNPLFQLAINHPSYTLQNRASRETSHKLDTTHSPTPDQ